MPDSHSVFLTAQWKHLAMLNYEVSPDLLSPIVPADTELDSWDGKHYISIVGFLFLNTRVFGIPIPFHRNFEEVNLRFYVRHKSDEGWRRGVAFIKELVPNRATAFLARLLYNENYTALLMSHDLDAESIRYSWKHRGAENYLALSGLGDSKPLEPGSKEEFITEHYWGYSQQKNGTTMEYRVQHPRWIIRNATSAGLVCDVAELFGEKFVEVLSRKPEFSFAAEGSDVIVYSGAGI